MTDVFFELFDCTHGGIVWRTKKNKKKKKEKEKKKKKKKKI